MAARIKEESLVMPTDIHNYVIVYLHNCDSLFSIRYELLL